MIGKIKGILHEWIGNDGLIETSGGVSYLIMLPTIYRSTALPSEIEVYTYLHVREDANVLYGFSTRIELEVFHMLHAISGVGPKMAHTISVYAPYDQIKQAVKSNDVVFFTRIPGLGKKTALKILLELSQRFEKEASLHALVISSADEPLLEALMSIGFEEKQIRQILPQLGNATSLEEKITLGIQKLSGR